MSKQRIFKDPRSKETREVRRKFLILVEGRSEENYFKRFIKRNSSLKVIPIVAKRRDPGNIIKICVQKSEEYDISDVRKDKVVVVYDIDQNTAEQICQCDKKCVKSNIDMYLSSPSFECWLIMHFRDVSNNDTQDVLVDSMTRELGYKYNKSKNINGKISEDMIKDAISRSSNIIPDFKNRNSDCMIKGPSSTLHFLVQELLFL